MGPGILIVSAVWLALTGVAQARVSPQNAVDAPAFSQIRKDGFQPSELCSDEVFVRRVFLDLTGTLPTVGEVRAFLESKDSGKRAQLIDELLERPEFADYRALKWCDLLRVKAEFPSNLWPNAVQAYHRWVRDAFRRNMPYDQFVRALLTAGGSNFRDPPSNFYRPFQERTPRRIFETVALLFMGVRLEHSGWSEEELLGMDAFFAKTAYKKTGEWKEEIVYSDPQKQFLHPETKQPVAPAVPGGGPLRLDPFADPRVAFADWLTAPDNPWFTRAIINRVWCELMGRGLIHEVDDIRPDSKPWSPELMALLEQELKSSRYDLRHLYRLILNSAVYQLSSVPVPENIADETGFSRCRIRRLDAEVLIDAICQVTGTTEEYSSAIPEPFTFIPQTQRSITLADGSIKSPFLEMFGRPGRDTSYASERNNSVSVFQAMHLLNSSHIQDKIRNSPLLRQLIRSERDSDARVRELYLHILSRYPNAEEKEAIMHYLNTSGLTADEAVYDLAWALINSKEFSTRH